MTQLDARDQEIVERLKYDTPFYAKHHLRIVPREGGKVIPLVPNSPQLQFDAVLERQRKAGLPMRVICLKARKHGISTWTQAKLSQRYTQFEYHDAVVVAHDSATAQKLMKMGRIMWEQFPTNSFVPKLSEPKGRKSKEMHFSNHSSLLVDTAENLNSGAGFTILSLHLSELAKYRDPKTKMTAIGNAVPDVPESLVVIESTAEGDNYFKELWDQAEKGAGDYLPVFLPWFTHPDYRRPFMNEADRDQFEATIGKKDEPLRVEEPEQVELMKAEGYGWDEILERLHWRLIKIQSAEIGSDLKRWKQEFPSTPSEAFIVSGSKVFSVHLTSKVVERCRKTDEAAGRGVLKAAATKNLRSARSGKLIEVAFAAEWESEHAATFDAALWKVWQHPLKAGDKDPERPDEPLGVDRQYVVNVDPANDDQQVESDDAAFHSIQVIDHVTRRQVAVYRAQMDADLVGDQAFFAALYWNRAWICSETTGGRDSMVLAWKHDYHYPFVYTRRKEEDEENRDTNLLGWDTNRRTKPRLIDLGREILREGTTGLRCVQTALEMRDLVKLPNGKIGPPRNGYSDCFMAWIIAQYIADQLPLKQSGKKRDHRPFQPKNEVGGY